MKIIASTIVRMFGEGMTPEIAVILAAMLAGVAAVFGETRDHASKRITATGYLILIAVLTGTAATLVVALRNRLAVETALYEAAAHERSAMTRLDAERREQQRHRAQQEQQLAAIAAASKVHLVDRVTEIGIAYVQASYAIENISPAIRNELGEQYIASVADLSEGARTSLRQCCQPTLHISFVDAGGIEVISLSPVQLGNMISVDEESDAETTFRVTYEPVPVRLETNSGGVRFIEDLIGTTAVVSPLWSVQPELANRVDEITLMTSAGRRILLDQITYQNPARGTVRITEDSIR